MNDALLGFVCQESELERQIGHPFATFDPLVDNPTIERGAGFRRPIQEIWILDDSGERDRHVGFDRRI